MRAAVGKKVIQGKKEKRKRVSEVSRLMQVLEKR